MNVKTVALKVRYNLYYSMLFGPFHLVIFKTGLHFLLSIVNCNGMHAFLIERGKLFEIENSQNV